jgi:transposase
MEIILKETQVWMASEPVDFRKGINGLSALAYAYNQNGVSNQLYIFYNRAKNKLKILGYHRNGYVLVYKQLDKKHFAIKEDTEVFCALTQEQLTWLLAGLDWVEMSEFDMQSYPDFY